ncbi:hypothetical protein LN449_14125 [Xanthomonas cannabis]|uniref:chemotaxis protein CheB n=1 Tax=Xanthomonas cannabis TaxID=1885674 RepID=UPI001E499D74|nr:chemotaxis protein CheB [Xanthomonas cannabis]MCC8443648.1 hypothetical protein [Xanthomonas cannabis]
MHVRAILGDRFASGLRLRRLLPVRTRLPAPILVVMHLSARGDGMGSMVRRVAPQFTVHVAEDGQVLLPGHIYVAVPDRYLMLNGERLALGVGPRENMSRPAIDALFRSAALVFGPRVVGVLLSGMLGAGAAGLEAIQACGGAVATAVTIAAHGCPAWHPLRSAGLVHTSAATGVGTADALIWRTLLACRHILTTTHKLRPPPARWCADLWTGYAGSYVSTTCGSLGWRPWSGYSLRR